MTAPVLAHPDYTKPFSLITDASYRGLGFILSQVGENGKEHPIKYAISGITLISMLIGGVFAIDSRYAKASDFDKQQQLINDKTIEMRVAIDELRKQTVIDKVFELELIEENKRTQADKARLQKYRQDIRDIELKWRKND